jgi:hypothetical protein
MDNLSQGANTQRSVSSINREIAIDISFSFMMLTQVEKVAGHVFDFVIVGRYPRWNIFQQYMLTMLLSQVVEYVDIKKTVLLL